MENKGIVYHNLPACVNGAIELQQNIANEQQTQLQSVAAKM